MNERLRGARRRRNWTQEDVASRVGTTRLTVSRWERGQQAPQLHYRELLCSLFEMSPEELGLPGEAPDPEDVDWRASGSVEEEARLDLVQQVRRYWIGAELEDRIGDLSWLDLTLAERPSAVSDPVQLLPRPRQSDRVLAAGTTIWTAFQDSGRRMLILGDSGAGKTMQLLYLTNALLSRGDGGPAGPVPVVFHLSSWTLKRRSLSRWLVDELEIRYGVTRRLGEAWVRSRSIMPMLDGLDEVAEEHRADCVAAINVFLTVHGQLPVAVCCRTERYEALPVRLALRSAVVLQPLARADVERYLRGGGRSLIGVSAVLHDDEQLWGLLKTPLFLSVVGSTYRDRPPEALPATGEPGARRRRIVADYAEAMLNRPHVVPSPYGRDDTVRWLRWLASQMRSRGQSIFYPDLMQPDWLPSALARTVAMAGVTAGIVLGCALSGLMLAVVVQRAVGLLHLPVLLDLDAGLGPNPPWEVKLRLPLLALGPIIGAVNGALLAVLTHMTTIAPTERLRWYWPPPTRDLARTAAGVLIAVVLSTELGNEVGRFLGTVGFLLVVGLLLYFPDAERAREPDGRHGSLVPMAVAVVAASVLGLVLALQLAGSSGAQVVDLAETLPHRAVFGLVFTLTVGVALATLETRLQVVPQAPGEGMRRTRRSAVAAAGVAWLMVGVVVLLVDGLFFGPVTGAVDGLTIGAGAGMFVGLKRGGRAYLHHWAMRGVLTRMGVAPRDLVGFLDFASGLALLRRHGGGYEFIHSLVLDHFAGAGR